jgi:hypothetical protein
MTMWKKMSGVGVLVFAFVSSAGADDAERIAMTRVYLPAEASLAAGRTRVGSVHDHFVKDPNNEYVVRSYSFLDKSRMDLQSQNSQLVVGGTIPPGGGNSAGAMPPGGGNSGGNTPPGGGASGGNTPPGGNNSSGNTPPAGGNTPPAGINNTPAGINNTPGGINNTRAASTTRRPASTTR